MASFAHSQHLSQYYVRERAERAEVSFQYAAYTVELFARLGRLVIAAVRPTLQRWMAAHQQAVQDRMFWQLALTDPRVMAELRAMRDRAEQESIGRR